MLRDRNFEYNHGSDSILDQVEGMKDEHISEAPDKSADVGVDQAPEGMNDLVLSFRSKLESSELSNQEDVDQLNSLIAKVAELDPDQAETLKQEFLNKKIS